MSGERQPLLANGAGSHGSGALPMKPMMGARASFRSLDPGRNLSLIEAARAAVAADLRARVPDRVQRVIARKAALIRRRRHTEDEGELADIIARTPDLEAIFAGEDVPTGGTPFAPIREDGTPGPGLCIAPSLANSYGTLSINSSSTRAAGHERYQSVSSSTAAAPSPAVTRPPTSKAAVSSSAEFDEPLEMHNSLVDQITNPVGKYRRIWLLIIFLFVLFNAIVVPFLLAFQSTWSDMHVIVGLLVVSYIGDFFFCLDVVLYFFTPIKRDGLYERNLEDIKQNYLTSWFVPDLISSFPLDLILLPFFGIKVSLFARFTRFLRFSKYESYFSVWEQYSTRFPQGVRFFKLMLGLQLILHWLGCFWFYCGVEHGMGSTTWLPDYEFKHADVTTQYIMALWWATNIITQVGGDPGLPTNNFERLADFFVAFVAVFVVAMVIGNVSELVAELSADEGELRNKLGTLGRFMYARRLPEELQDRIRNYYFNLWSRRGVMDGDTVILAELPSNLRTEVSLSMYKDILLKVPIFQSSSPGFINSLVLHLKPQTYIPKEIIVKQGDSGAEMFFVSRGTVSVLVSDRVVGRIGEGGWFGEVAAISPNSLRTATIVAMQYCDVFVLTHDDLQSLFRVFPAERAIIMHVAETRRAKDLLRKTLTDPLLLAREQQAPDGIPAETPPSAFEAHPVLVNLLIDLFQPLDLVQLAAHNCGDNQKPHLPRSTTLTMGGLTIDEHGEIVDSFDPEAEEALAREHEQEGVVFSPADEAHTLYFVGKGCVDIFAHPDPAEQEAAQHAREAEREKLRRQRLEDEEEGQATDSHDEADEDEVDYASPQHVIRLTEGHFFGCISNEFYQVSAVVPPEFRGTDADGTGSEDAIIFALTSHDLHQLHDYYAQLPADPEDDEEDEEASPAAPGSRAHLKRALVTWLQRHRTPSDYVRSMVSLALNASLNVHGPSTHWQTLLSSIVDKIRARSAAAAAAKKLPLAHGFAASARNLRRLASTDSKDQESTASSPSPSSDASVATPPSGEKKAPLITVSPPAEPSPNIQVEPYVLEVISDSSLDIGTGPSAVRMGTLSGTSTGASTAVNSPELLPAASSTSPPRMPLALQQAMAALSPPSSLAASRPPLHRASSLGARPDPAAATSPFSPLLQIQRLPSTATSGDVSELLAQADMHHQSRNLQPQALSRVPSCDEIPGTPNTANATASPPPPQQRVALDWLTSASSSTLPPQEDNFLQRSRSVLSPPAPSSLSASANLLSSPIAGKPSLVRMPSVPVQPQRIPGGRACVNAMQAQQSALSSTPAPMLRRLHQRTASSVAPFSFLLSLPQQSPAGAGTGGAPTSPGLTSAYSMVSPRMSSSNLAAGPGDKRGSATPSRRHSISLNPSMAPKRVEALEKSLSGLSNEDLLLIANKATLHLYARMQQQQATAAQQLDAAQAAALPTPSSLVTPTPRF